MGNMCSAPPPAACPCSLADFEAKQRRGAGNGRTKTLRRFLQLHAKCTETCTQAVALGEALGQAYDLGRSVPAQCFGGTVLT